MCEQFKGYIELDRKQGEYWWTGGKTIIGCCILVGSLRGYNGGEVAGTLTVSPESGNL